MTSKYALVPNSWLVLANATDVIFMLKFHFWQTWVCLKFGFLPFPNLRSDYLSNSLILRTIFLCSKLKILSLVSFIASDSLPRNFSVEIRWVVSQTVQNSSAQYSLGKTKTWVFSFHSKSKILHLFPFADCSDWFLTRRDHFLPKNQAHPSQESTTWVILSKPST